MMATTPAVELQPRTYLFVPGSRPDRFGKALASGADEIILDLEDAVPPDDKPAAIQAVSAWLGDHAGMVRVNAPGTPWHDDEVRILASTRGLKGLVLPKATAPTVRDTAKALGQRVPVLPLVETAEGIGSVNDIAAQSAAARLLIGTLDLALELGIDQLRGDEPGLLYARSRLVLASALHGLPGPVDGVHPHLNDADGLERSIQRGRELGFTAKLCIHPRQVEVVHNQLSPTPDEMAWAQRVTRIGQQVRGRATQDSGEMLDVPQYRRAARILALARLPQDDHRVAPPMIEREP